MLITAAIATILTAHTNAASTQTAATQAAATEAAAPTVAWVNRYGTLANVEVRQASNGSDYVVGQLVSVAKDDAAKRAPTRFTVFNPTLMAEILKRGNGEYISMRGPIEKRDVDGGKYSTSAFKGVMLNVSKAEREAAAA